MIASMKIALPNSNFSIRIQDAIKLQAYWSRKCIYGIHREFTEYICEKDECIK